MSRTYRNILLVAGLLVCAGVIGFTGWFFTHPAPLTIQGEVDAKHVNVSAKIPARVLAIHVRKGDRVTRGQLLVTLESPEIKARLSQAQAASRAAAAQKEKAQFGAREEEVSAARSNWQRAVVATDLAEKTYQRTARLYADGIVSSQKHDEAEAQFRAAQKQAEAAQAVYQMAINGARKEDRTAAAAQADQAAGVVSEVRTYYEETKIVAPMDGEIVDLLAEPGEMVNAGYPIIRVLDTTDIWVVFHIREDMLTGLRVGDALAAHIPAATQKETALKVTYLSAMGDFATWKATKASGDFDLKTFEVQARPEKAIAALRPGMSVIVNWDRSRNMTRPKGYRP